MNRWKGKSSRVLKALPLLLSLVLAQKAWTFPPDSLKNLKFGILPTVYYTPETRVGFGALYFNYFKTNKKDSTLRKSNTQTFVTYTLNKQFSIENDYQLWLAKNRFYVTGYLDYSRFPQFFFGIGNNTQQQERVTFSADFFRIQTRAFTRVRKNFYAGLFFQLKNVHNLDMALMSHSPEIPVHGNMGFSALGIGPEFLIDKRDNPLNPTKGSYFEASLVDYSLVFKNQYMFSSLTVDARKYQTFFNRFVWNGNAYFSFNKGNVPFSLMPEIGGARFLRGYYKGRFRDNNLIVLQQEVRIPLYKMFGIAVFGGVGSVANSFKMFKDNRVHYNYGIGLRVRINKHENTNLRIDYGFTKDSHGLYIVFAEAF